MKNTRTNTQTSVSGLSLTLTSKLLQGNICIIGIHILASILIYVMQGFLCMAPLSEYIFFL